MTPAALKKPSPVSFVRRDSRWTLISWIVLFAGVLLTLVAYQIAYTYRPSGARFPAISQLLIGSFATGFATLYCGLAAFFRAEPRRWMALPPLIVGAYSTIHLLGVFWAMTRLLPPSASGG